LRAHARRTTRKAPQSRSAAAAGAQRACCTPQRRATAAYAAARRRKERASAGNGGALRASHLQLAHLPGELRAVELLRTAGSGALSTTLGLSLWSRLEVGTVTRLRCNHSAAHLWDERVLSRFSTLRVLNLSGCGLVALPGVIAALSELQELRLVGNRLKLLPPELGQLRALRVLAADSNELTILPGAQGKGSHSFTAAAS
jgi:hypothetical protein